MNKFKRALAVLAIAVTPAMASAAPVNLDTWYGFSFGGTGTSLAGLGGAVPGTNPSVTAAPDAPWDFTLTSPAVLFVLDIFQSSDRFDIYNFGALLGSTSAPVDGGTCDSDITCAIADARYSRGSFALGAGSYSITGIQTAGTPGAGAFIVKTSPVPIPAAGGLLAGALALIGGLRLRRSRRA